LAGAQVGDVLTLGLETGGGVDVGEVVGERGVEAGPVAAHHGLKAQIVGAEDLGLGGGRLSHASPPFRDRGPSPPAPVRSSSLSGVAERGCAWAMRSARSQAARRIGMAGRSASSIS